MGYLDFWFIDKRVQTRNLIRWFLYIVIIFAFVGVGTAICVKSMYQPFTNYIIEENILDLKVNEAKKTNANGYIECQITNNENVATNGKYIKAEFYTKNNVNIGNEYVEIGTVNSQETKTYELKFRYSNVERMVLKIVDSQE